MEYKIGELSKIMNVSKEMIRYYEKKGALKPSRQSENNYRSYDSMDAFNLMEIIQYQSLGFTLKDVTKMKAENYMEQYGDHLDEYYETLGQEISYKQILQRRVRELSEITRSCHMNHGNFWIKEVRQQKAFFLCTAKDDEYGPLNSDSDVDFIMFSTDYMPFLNPVIIFGKEKDTWYYAMDDYYYRHLHIDVKADADLTKEFCLCTVVDMGEVGDFNRECLKDALKYVKDHGYVIKGDIRGVIIARGFENGVFKRYLEIYIPIEER